MGLRIVDIKVPSGGSVLVRKIALGEGVMVVWRLLPGCVHVLAVQDTGWVLYAFFQIPSTRETSIQKSRNLTYHYRLISLIKDIRAVIFLV